MSEETARQAIDFALRESGKTAMVTFFGGETLMNFPVLKKTVTYARARAAEVGKDIDFSLTTNATLLKPDVIEFLADERDRRHDLDRRAAGDPGQVPRLPQRQGQLRRGGAEDQGAAGPAHVAADRRARHA